MGPLWSETTSARSSKPGFLIPEWMPAARNPCGAVTPRREDGVGVFFVILMGEMSCSMWTRSLRKNSYGTAEIQGSAHLGQQRAAHRMLKKSVQQGRSKRRGVRFGTLSLARSENA